MIRTKSALAAALCAGIGLLSLTSAQAAPAPTTPGTSLAALLARLQADETKRAADEATMTSQAATMTSQGATITSQGATITHQSDTIATLQSQVSAVAGVPKNAALLAQTPVPAPGYTYTGDFIALSGSAWTYWASMNTVRFRLAAASVGNTIYAIGGDNNTGRLSSMEAYDPATNTWISKASMNTARADLAAASVGNTLYALGGGNDSSGYLSSVEAITLGYFVHLKN